MRGRVGKTEVPVLARENRTSAASAPGTGNLAKTVPSDEGRTQRKRACPLTLKRFERSEKKWGKKGFGPRDSGFGNQPLRGGIGYWDTGYSTY
jgi:hypothetical protein